MPARRFAENGLGYEDYNGRERLDSLRRQGDEHIRPSAAIPSTSTSGNYLGTEAEKEKPLIIGWRRLIRNFTSPWFTVVMGTGLVSILLHQMPSPYDSKWARILGTIVFVLNLVLFIIFSFITTLRYVLFPEIIPAVLKSSQECLFFGAFPMGLATLINMFVYVCVEPGHWGPWAVNFAWAWFWVDAVIATLCTLGVPVMMMTLHTLTLPTMTGAWLMAALPPIVASGTGAILASVLHDPQHALWTVMVSYFLWGFGMIFALTISALLFARLVLFHAPPKEEVATLVIAIGPLGMGGFALQKMGEVTLTVFPQTKSMQGERTAEVFYNLGFIVALIMWAYAIAWLFWAVAAIVYRRKLPFNMSWWSFIFPLGVWTLSTYQLGHELDSRFLKIWGLVFAGILVLLWFAVSYGTVIHCIKGDVFDAPWLDKVNRDGDSSHDRGRRRIRGYSGEETT